MRWNSRASLSRRIRIVTCARSSKVRQGLRRRRPLPLSLSACPCPCPCPCPSVTPSLLVPLPSLAAAAAATARATVGKTDPPSKSLRCRGMRQCISAGRGDLDAEGPVRQPAALRALHGGHLRGGSASQRASDAGHSTVRRP